MTDPCCSNQQFTRDTDPSIADIGSAVGAEFTIGSCASCHQPLIDVLVSAANASTLIPVETSFIDTLIAASKTNSQKEMLTEWWESR